MGKENPSIDRDYKTSQYADFIEELLGTLANSYMLHEGELPQQVKIIEQWASWLLEEGFQKSQAEIYAKLDEMSVQDKMT